MEGEVWSVEQEDDCADNQYPRMASEGAQAMIQLFAMIDFYSWFSGGAFDSKAASRK